MENSAVEQNQILQIIMDNEKKQINAIHSRSIIVHLPIDLTSMHYYKQPHFESKIHDNTEIDAELVENYYRVNDDHNKEQQFNPQSFNLHGDLCHYNQPTNNNNNNCNTTAQNKIINHSDHHQCHAKNIIFIDDAKEYTKNITKLISAQYYYCYANKHQDVAVSGDICEICCWYCSDKIHTIPCGIPIKYENNEFHVKGFFCSFGCALAYNYHSNEFETIIQEREALIRMLYTWIYPSKNGQDLSYAPKRECLKIFGGTLTYPEFHKNNHTIVNIVTHPMIPLLCFIEENYPVMDDYVHPRNSNTNS